MNGVVKRGGGVCYLHPHQFTMTRANSGDRGWLRGWRTDTRVNYVSVQLDL